MGAMSINESEIRIVYDNEYGLILFVINVEVIWPEIPTITKSLIAPSLIHTLDCTAGWLTGWLRGSYLPASNASRLNEIETIRI